jgi:hypothetical protein
VRKLALVVCALASVVAVGLPARADAPQSYGQLCDLQATDDPTAEAGTSTGELTGGPILLLDQEAAPETGTLTCRVQVGVADHTGTGPSVSGHGTGLLTAGPSTVTYSGGGVVYVCGEFTDDSDGLTYYWDGVNEDWSTDSTVTCLRRLVCVAGIGCENTGAVVCVAAIGCNGSGTLLCVSGAGCNDYESTVCVSGAGCNNNGDTVCVAGIGCNNSPSVVCVAGIGCNSGLDPIICPVLAIVYPPEGDIPGIWDCPPYGNR